MLRRPSPRSCVSHAKLLGAWTTLHWKPRWLQSSAGVHSLTEGCPDVSMCSAQMAVGAAWRVLSHSLKLFHLRMMADRGINWTQLWEQIVELPLRAAKEFQGYVCCLILFLQLHLRFLMWVLGDASVLISVTIDVATSEPFLATVGAVHVQPEPTLSMWIMECCHVRSLGQLRWHML